MAESENTMDILTKTVVDARVKGYTFEEIAAKQEIDITYVIGAWKEYVDTRMVMSPEEQWVLMLLRLENLLVKANRWIETAEKAEDFELVLKTLDRIEALQALNKARKTEATDALVQLTKAQTQIILTAMVTLQSAMKTQLEEAFQGKTIKAIKGEVLDNFDSNFLSLAQLALTASPEDKV
jgi:tRNA U34 2-thiouridine synthase MnmA/TrmU